MPDPVAVLAEIRQIVRPDGTVLVMDESVGEEFTAPGDDIERLTLPATAAAAAAT